MSLFLYLSSFPTLLSSSCPFSILRFTFSFIPSSSPHLPPLWVLLSSLAFLFIFTSLPSSFFSSLPSSLFTAYPSLTLLLPSPFPSLLLPPLLLFTTFPILPLTVHLCSYSTGVSITSLSYSPDASHLATGLTTGEVKVFEISSSSVIFTLSKPEVRNWWIGDSMTPCVLRVLVMCLQLKLSNSSATFLLLLLLL